MADKQPDQQTPPVLEIKPSEEVHPRPLWQRIGAFILIGIIVAATVACAFWRLG